MPSPIVAPRALVSQHELTVVPFHAAPPPGDHASSGGAPLPADLASPPHQDHRASRRRALRSLGGLIASAGALASVAPARSAQAGPVVSIAADVDPTSLLHRLISRTCYSVTPADLALANTLGHSGFLEYQLAHTNIMDDPGLLTKLAVYRSLTCHAFQLYDTTIIPNNSVIVNELIDATILRAAYSRRQLFEKMVEFWSDHFHIDLYNAESLYLKTLHDRTIRQHALTSFPQLFLAEAHSAAMLAYLNNDISSDDQINENYAREMLELHTIGAETLYSYPPAAVQATITSVARCLTGWGRYSGTHNDTSIGGNGTLLRGADYFNGTGIKNRVMVNGSTFTTVVAGAHDTDAKALGPLFGNAVIPAGRFGSVGRQDALDVFALLVAHPATATHVSRKMCERFLGEGVPLGVVNAVRDTYLNASNPQGIGDIKAMLRVILSPNLLASSSPLFKRPFHAYVGALRSLPSNVTSPSTLRNQFVRAGHLPFAWSAPDGYPISTTYWANQILPRWRYFSSLITKYNGDAGGDTGATVDDSVVFAGTGSPDEVVDRIDQTLFAGALRASDRAQILGTLGVLYTEAQRRDALSLALCSPSNQWC